MLVPWSVIKPMMGEKGPRWFLLGSSFDYIPGTQIKRVGNLYFQHLGAQKWFFVKHSPLLVAFGLGYFLLPTSLCLVVFGKERDEYGGIVKPLPNEERFKNLPAIPAQSYKVPILYNRHPQKSSHTEHENLPDSQKRVVSFRKMCFFLGKGVCCSPTGHSIQLFGWRSSWHKGRRAGVFWWFSRESRPQKNCQEKFMVLNIL